jgi:hypothetical protein
MNRYFKDTLYYLKQAGKTAKKGVSEEVEPVEQKVRSLTGREKEPEPSRLDRVRERLAEVRETVERKGRGAADRYRPRRT